MSKAGRPPGPRKRAERAQCRHLEWKNGELVRCEKLAAPRQVYCCRSHAPYGDYDVDEHFIVSKEYEPAA